MTDQERIDLRDYVRERFAQQDVLIAQAVERIELAHTEGMNQLAALSNRVALVEGSMQADATRNNFIRSVANTLAKTVAAIAAAVAAYLGIRSGS